MSAGPAASSESASIDPAALARLVVAALDGVRTPAWVLTPVPLDLVAAGGDAAIAAAVRQGAPGDPRPEDLEGPVRTLLLVARDAEELRRLVSRCARVGGARHVGVVAPGAGPLLVRGRPGWPPVRDLDAGPDITRLEFAARTDAAPVLLALARAAVSPGAPEPRPAGPLGVRVAGAVVPPVDPTATPAYDPDAERPADVLLLPAEAANQPEPAEAAVTGRVPAVLRADSLGADPLDEGRHRPVGFRRDAAGPVVALADLPPGPVDRALRGVRVGPHDDPRRVAALAMAGVPLVGGAFGEPDLADDDVREAHSVQVRTDALRTHGTAAWRARLADAAGVRHAEPDVVLVESELPGAPVGPGLRDALLLALQYSGADVVGAATPDQPAECALAPADAVAALAGRPLLVRAAALREHGGWQAVLAAGGVGYLTRVPPGSAGSPRPASPASPAEEVV